MGSHTSSSETPLGTAAGRSQHHVHWVPPHLEFIFKRGNWVRSLLVRSGPEWPRHSQSLEEGVWPTAKPNYVLQNG